MKAMVAVSIEEAQATLPALIDQLAPGEELVITRNERPVARLIGQRTARKPRQPGNCKGMLNILVEDEEHLKDFAEYML